MKIIELTAENVKRLRAVDITPAEHVQIVGGRNAQGKTSVLDAIWLALGGGPASKATVRPIRDGEDHASVRLDLGDLIVTRTWRGDKTTLTVASSDGARYGSPQGVLDALVGRLSFDPLAFTHMSARDQVAALLDLVDLDVDLDDIARQRQAAFDRRTEIGRQGKALGDVPHPIAGVPDAEVSASELIGQIRAAQDANRRIEDAQIEAGRRRTEIESLERNLTFARERLTEAEAVISGQPISDTSEMERRLSQIEETNQAVRRNAEIWGLREKKDTLRGEYDALTGAIDSLDRTRSEALAAAAFPVDGLGFDADGVTYGGVPFSQASSAEQIRVSLAMAMAMNPKLRVIRILDGSLLDADNLALIGAMAVEHDFQVWVERIEGGGDASVLIEDGRVVSR